MTGMQNNSERQWQLGSLFGIPLLIDPSWLFIVGLLTFINAVAWQDQFPDWGVSLTWFTGLSTALLLFASVLLHELGHSLVAKAQGITVKSITLFLFGGIASLDSEAKTPNAAFWVAIAGPLVSCSLWLGLSLVGQITPANRPLHELCQDLASLNLILVLFNLIPGLPLDGGQVLKAVVWQVTGSRFKGSHWAATAGQWLGWIAIVLGLFIVLLLGSFSGIWMALLGWYGVQNATRYDRYTDLQEIVLSLNANDVMVRSFRVVNGKQTIRDFAESYLINQLEPTLYFAAADGRYQGRVETDRINVIERSLWNQQTVQALVTPLSELPSVVESTPLTDVILTLEKKNLLQLIVLSPAGAIAGIIDRGDIVKAILAKMGLALPEEELASIKKNGTYPNTLQLPALVQAALNGEGKEN